MRIRPAFSAVVAGAMLSVGALGAPDDTSSVLNGLPECPAHVRSIPREWRVVTSPTDVVVVHAPPSFEPFEKGVAYVHGGAAWRSGSAELEIVYGIWSRSSFTDLSKACRTTTDGMPTLYRERSTANGVSLFAWFMPRYREARSSLPHQPVVGAWSSRPEDLAMLRSIVRSVRKAP